MPTINWGYVAGFFDADGSAYVQRRRSSQPTLVVTFAQAGAAGEYVLPLLREFLRNHGINSSLVRSTLKAEKYGHQVMYNIIIEGRWGVIRSLEGMMPYLCVKRTIAQDFLRYFKIFPSLKPYALMIARSCRTFRGNAKGEAHYLTTLTEKDVIQIRILWALRKYSQRGLGRMFGITGVSVSAIVRGKNWKHLLPFNGDNQTYGIPPSSYLGTSGGGKYL